MNNSKLENKLFSQNEILEDSKMNELTGGASDPCCDVDQATTHNDGEETCGDTANTGTDFWADVKWVWPR